MTSQEVRRSFLDFFLSKSHKIVPSIPIINNDDSKLMFINAGMNAFKDIFLDQSVPQNPRVSNTQKCLRVSGKHNDLEEVGKDTYHHTMFEMLGNWSFGDYFKAEAIKWAWELFTEVFKISEDLLYVTVFEGDTKDGTSLDQEAYDIWSSIIDKDKIIYGNKKDNFWEMGDQGPCGPCSEIHIDLRSEQDRKKISGKELVNKDHPLVIELWNLVFIEFNRKSDKKLERLPKKHIDTGLGFERLCMVMQKVESTYDTDLFKPLIREINTLTMTKYGTSKDVDIAIRVIADHVRAISFSIADGQLPSNNGRGYVIRRILRRAIRYGYTYLNQKKPFVYKLVDVLTNIYKTQFTELQSQKNLIKNVIYEEEKSFLNTLEKGLNLLESILSATNHNKALSGENAFLLYDTYGFPPDLTELILSERGFKMDKKGFDANLKNQIERSKRASEVITEDWIAVSDDNKQEFVGYDILETEVRITKYRKIKNADGDSFFQMVFNLTPFYPESGGQVGDKGYLKSENGDLNYIIDTKKYFNTTVHITKNLPKNLNKAFLAMVDEKQRFRTSCNHTATHLLHQALRTVLGGHVEQKGSKVHSTHLRFDFSHHSKVTEQELIQIENFINLRIQDGIALEEKRNVPYENAISEGAVALFDEKYGDTVRTVRFAESYELCGGTHVKNTAQLWHCVITSETAVASGIRRIEAITYEKVRDHFKQKTELYSTVNKLLKTNDALKQVNNLIANDKKQKDTIKTLKNELIQSFRTMLPQEVIEHKGIQLLVKVLKLDHTYVKDIIFGLTSQNKDLCVVIASDDEHSPKISMGFSKNIAKKDNYDANEILKKLLLEVGGKGGGQSFYATIQLEDVALIHKSLALLKSYIIL